MSFEVAVLMLLIGMLLFCGVADRYIDIVKRDGYPNNRMVCKRNYCPNCGADMRGEQE